MTANQYTNTLLGRCYRTQWGIIRPTKEFSCILHVLYFQYELNPESFTVQRTFRENNADV